MSPWTLWRAVEGYLTQLPGSVKAGTATGRLDRSAVRLHSPLPPGHDRHSAAGCRRGQGSRVEHGSLQAIASERPCRAVAANLTRAGAKPLAFLKSQGRYVVVLEL
jgi:hypothetical protein